MALRTVYFMAKQDIASVKYPDFIDFLVMQGRSSLNAITTGGAASVSYRSHGIVSEMQESLATAIRDDIDKMLNDSDFISILTDESCDITTTKKLIIINVFCLWNSV